MRCERATSRGKQARTWPREVMCMESSGEFPVESFQCTRARDCALVLVPQALIHAWRLLSCLQNAGGIKVLSGQVEIFAD